MLPLLLRGFTSLQLDLLKKYHWEKYYNGTCQEGYIDLFAVLCNLKLCHFQKDGGLTVTSPFWN